MDSNMAFAKHWDRMNPSDFVKACTNSKMLQEEEQERQKKRRELYEADRITIATLKKNETDEIKKIEKSK